MPVGCTFGADLGGANLSEAILRQANLTGADVTEEQLAQAASLEGAIMPDGTTYAGKPALSPTEPESQDTEEQGGRHGAPDADGDSDA